MCQHLEVVREYVWVYFLNVWIAISADSCLSVEQTGKDEIPPEDLLSKSSMHNLD